MTEPPKFMDRIPPKGVAENMAISGIEREIEEITRYARWLRQSAQAAPRRFNKTMITRIVQVKADLELALTLVEEYMAKQAEQDDE